MKSLYKKISDASSDGRCYVGVHIVYSELGLGHFEKIREILEEDGYKFIPGSGSMNSCNFKIEW